MDRKMEKKIQKVLEGVKDPVSNLPIVELDLVEKVRYLEEKGELIIFTAFPMGGRPCMNCAGVNMLMANSVRRHLREDFEKAFPELKISLDGDEETSD